MRRFAHVPQAGLALDPNNSSLEGSLTATKEAQEIDRQERWRRAAAERAVEEERLKKQNEAKATEAKVKTEAAGAKAKASAVGSTDGGQTNEDPLASFFTAIEGKQQKPPPAKVERVLHDKYTSQDLGSPKEQMDRLLQHNYKWKNLNAFEALQLGPDATVEDVKHRWRIGLQYCRMVRTGVILY